MSAVVIAMAPVKVHAPLIVSSSARTAKAAASYPSTLSASRLVTTADPLVTTKGAEGSRSKVMVPVMVWVPSFLRSSAPLRLAVVLATVTDMCYQLCVVTRLIYHPHSSISIKLTERFDEGVDHIPRQGDELFGGIIQGGFQYPGRK